MIVDIILLITAAIFSALVFILPGWTVWPADLLNGITYFFSLFGTLNILIPGLAADLLALLLFYTRFEAAYFTARKIVQLFNFVFKRNLGI